jgi:DNA-binding transcriptional MerR regulator
MGQEKTTIQAAAKALNISIKTIQRYLNNGTLSKIKEGNRTYLLVDEIRTLRQGQNEGTKKDVWTEHRDKDNNIITVNRTKYEELLQEIGHYKGQLEGQTRYLLEYKETIETKDRTLLEQKAIIEQKGKELTEAERLLKEKDKVMEKAGAEIQKLRAEVKKAEELEKEIQRLKLPFWKRIFSK